MRQADPESVLADKPMSPIFCMPTMESESIGKSSVFLTHTEPGSATRRQPLRLSNEPSRAARLLSLAPQSLKWVMTGPTLVADTAGAHIATVARVSRLVTRTRSLSAPQ